MNKQFYVYILTNERNGTLYVGMTSNLAKRVWEHKNEVVEGFTKKYGTKQLVYYEIFDNVDSAIQREKRLKKWDRPWKLKTIEKDNPQWKDLYEKLTP